MSEEVKTETSTVSLTEEQVKQVLDVDVTVKISLIRQMANIIDVCQKRGVFKSEELEGVGSLFKVLANAVSEASKRVVTPTPEKPALEPIQE